MEPDRIAPPVVSAGQKEFLIPDLQSRIARRERQTREMEQNQKDLRTSIDESKRLVEEAEAMIRRHRGECEAAERDEAAVGQ